MGTYAVISGTTVTNIIVADDKEDAENALGVVLVEFSEHNPAGIGWIYDWDNGVFIQPDTERNDV